ncbi:MAG: hypothetical protein L0287_19990, partial [Anaerolineae bacterium]|nr:hypothetical protein [Anaerolineae bacterium]
MSHQGTCSIYVYSLFGLNGKDTFIFVLVAGVVSSLLGIGLLYSLLRPLSEFAGKIISVNVIFLILALAGLLSALPRFWGCTLLFNAGALLV